MKRQPQAWILRITEFLRLEKPFKDQVQLALFFSKKPVRKGKKATAPQSTAISIPGKQVMYQLCSKPAEVLCRELWRIPSLPDSITWEYLSSGDWN